MGGGNLVVLAVDDNPGDACLLRTQLTALPGYETTFIHTTTAEAANRELASTEIDVVFVDFRLGAETGLEFLTEMRARGDIRPVIVLTGQGNERIAAESIRSGADEYLTKDDLSAIEIHRAILGARSRYQDRRRSDEVRGLLKDLQSAKTQLELQNRRLRELNETSYQFVDHVSHEFRTPLTVIREFASIVRDGIIGETNDEQCEYMETIMNRVDDLASLVDDMLDTSKLEAGMFGIRRTDCSVTEIIDQVARPLERRAAAYHVRIVHDIPDNLPKVHCDAEKAARVITNLVINAMKYGGERKTVTLRARADFAAHEVIISVIDQGPGISDEDLAALFRRFRQLDGSLRSELKGFGLGLSIAKELADVNLGEIRVESTRGVGSEFSFTLPTSERQPLLERYLSRLERVPDWSECVSVAVVTPSEPTDGPSLEELDRLLSFHSRRHDLWIRTNAARWIHISSATQAEHEDLLRRVHASCDEANRCKAGHPLPRLEHEHLGAWGPESDKSRSLDTLLLAVMEEQHAHA